MSDRPRVTLIIRAYNEEKHIGRLLAGVFIQTLVDELEVILVDSGSTDATVAIARRFPVKVVSIAPEDFSFGRSLNLGISHARGEYIVLASAHVYPVYADWLERLLEPFKDRTIALSYGKQRGNHSTQFAEHQIFAAWFPDESVERQNHPFCNNANAAIRRDLWEQHPYDESLSGLEDLAWASWAVEAGFTLAYVAEAEVVHVHEETPRQVFNRYRREAMALKQIQRDSRFSIFNFMQLLLTNLANDFRFALKAKLLRNHFWDIVWFRIMQFSGTYRGFHYQGQVTKELLRTFYYPRTLTRTLDRSQRKVQAIDYHSIHTREPAGDDQDSVPESRL